MEVKNLFGNNYGDERKGNSAPINEGDEYDVKIEDTGRDGDGITRIEGLWFLFQAPKWAMKFKLILLEGILLLQK